MKVTVKNISKAPQGIHTLGGLVTLEPGQGQRTFEVRPDVAERLQRQTKLFAVSDVRKGEGDDQSLLTAGPSDIALRAAEIDQAMRNELDKRDKRIAELEKTIELRDARIAELEKGAQPKQKPKAEAGSAEKFEAKHRGAGSYSIMNAAGEEVGERLTKADAEAFNALSDEDKIAYLSKQE